MTHSRDISRLGRTGAPVVNTNQDLRELVDFSADFPIAAQTLGKDSVDDYSGALWRWDANSIEDDDDLNTLLPVSHVGTGRWVKVTNTSEIPTTIWGTIVGDITNQTDLVDLIESLGAQEGDFYPFIEGEPNGFLSQSDTTITAVTGTRTLTVAPTGADFSYYAGSKLYTSTSQNIVWADVEGLHIFYFDKDTGVLATTTTFTRGIIAEHCIASILYWDATNKEIILDYPVNERHGISMSSGTHAYLHSAFGAQWVSGLAVSVPVTNGDGDDDSHAQFTMLSGEWRDEDLVNITAAKTNLTDTFRTIYREGVNGDWRQAPLSSFPVVLNTDVVQYNEWTGATWQLSNITNNDFVLAHLFVAATESAPGYFIVVGQNVYTSAGQAREGAEVELKNIDINGLPTPELLPIATFILQYQTGNTNGAKATIERTDGGGDYIDWRQSTVGSPGSLNLPAQISETEITAGTETALRSYAPADVVSMIDTHGVISTDDSVINIVTLTQAEYLALSPPEDSTLYLICG